MSHPESKSRIEIVAENVSKQETSRIDSVLRELPQHRETHFRTHVEATYEVHADVEPTETPTHLLESLAQEFREIGSKVELYYLDTEDPSRCRQALVTAEGLIDGIRRL